MQNQHVETSSRPPAAVTSPPGGRRRLVVRHGPFATRGKTRSSRARSHLAPLPHAGRCRLPPSALSHPSSPGPPVSILRRRRPRSRSSAGCDVPRELGGRARCDDRYLPYPIPHRMRCFCVNITSSSAGQAPPGREITALVAVAERGVGLGLTGNGLADAWAALKQSVTFSIRLGKPRRLC